MTVGPLSGVCFLHSNICPPDCHCSNCTAGAGCQKCSENLLATTEERVSLEVLHLPPCRGLLTKSDCLVGNTLFYSNHKWGELAAVTFFYTKRPFKKRACLKRQHVYEAVAVRLNGRVAEINFGLMSTNVYDGGRSRKVKNPHK